MNIESLFLTVDKSTRPPPLASDQFEFTIDRSGRKVVGLIGGLFGAKEQVRVQANRVFQIDVRLNLPDATMKVVRGIPCGVRVQGEVDSNQDAARAFLEVALKADFKFAPLVSRLLESAIGEYSRTIHGAFVHHMRESDGHNCMQKALVAALRTAGLPAKRITVAPVIVDTRDTVTLDDAGQPIAIRSQGSLESHQVGYKIRLAWGTSDEHVAGRLTYSGSVEGRTQGPPLANTVVPGQTQPLEYWLRTLLADALSSEDWAAVAAGEDQLAQRVKSKVSNALGLGTGRVVDTLVIYPVTRGGAELTGSTTKFVSRYQITGMKGEGIEVEHAIRYSLVDRDRWHAQNAPEPEAFFKQHVVEAARAFLIDKRFEEVVQLFLDGPTGERAFRDGIASRIGLAVKAIGHRLDSVATILAIPAMEFVHGRVIVVPARTYGLADPHVEPAISIEVRARVRQANGAGAVFARALSLFDNFESQVVGEIEQTARSQLRSVSALSYYSSPYVNGVRTVQDAATGEWHSLEQSDSQLQIQLQTAVDESLSRKFGLEATEFRLIPGEDSLIQRMGQLTRSSVTHHFDLKFARGDEETAIAIKAMATLFIGSIAPEHWSSFYHNANRLTLTEHNEKIRDTLLDTLRLMEGIVTNATPGSLQQLDVKEQIVQLFMRRMSEELGLVVRLFPLQITVTRPSAGSISAMEVEALKAELAEVYKRRITYVDDERGYRGGETREQMNKRIADIKEELAAAAAAQDANLERSQSVRIEQDPRTGRLIDARPPQEPPAGGQVQLRH